MKLSAKNTNRHRRGTSLIESLMAVAVISVLASLSYFVATNVLNSSSKYGFERDVAAVNAAVRTYIATGGDLTTATSNAQVIDRLKKGLSDADREQQVGSGGSLLDSNLTPVFVAADENDGQARVVWDAGLKRFVLTHDAVAGIAAFNFPHPTESTEAIADDTDRRSSVSYAPPGGWVWLHDDAPEPQRIELTSITPPGSYGGPGGFTPTPPTRLTLTPPSYSQPSSTLPLSAYPLPVIVTDTNPSKTSMQLIGINAGALTYNPHGNLLLEPGDTVHAIAVTADPDNWYDSAYVSESYALSPHTLEVAWQTPQAAVTYAEVGGAMIGVSPHPAAAAQPTPVITNLDAIDPKYISSSNFQLRWLHGEANPASALASDLPDFSGAVPTQPAPIDLAYWGNHTSLEFRAGAVALNTGYYSSSSVAETTLNALVADIPAPIITAQADGPDTYNSIHIALDTGLGETPVGARIFYTIDGTEPGVVTPAAHATLYTGPFLFERELCATGQVRARAYPPVAFAQWFNTSAETVLIRPPQSEISPTYTWLCDVASAGLCQLSWFVLADDLDVTSTGSSIHGRVGVGPSANLKWSGAPASTEYFVDPTATLTYPVPNPQSIDLYNPEMAAVALNAQGMDLPPTQTFGIISTTTTIHATAPDGANVIDIGGINLKGSNVITISGSPNDYFVLNVSDKIDISGQAQVIFAGVPASHIILNVHPGASVKFAGQALVFGATVLSPMAGVDVTGNAILTGSVVSGGNSRMGGSGVVSGETAFGCSGDGITGGPTTPSAPDPTDPTDPTDPADSFDSLFYGVFELSSF